MKRQNFKLIMTTTRVLEKDDNTDLKGMTTTRALEKDDNTDNLGQLF